MKSQFIVLLLGLGMFMGGGVPAQASALFYDSCLSVAQADSNEPRFHYAAAGVYRGKLGLSCEDLSSLTKGVQVLELGLYPATLALSHPAARSAIAGELAALGLTMANPAVLGVTVLTASGVVVFYFILKADIEACEQMNREQLREEIVKEVKTQLGISARGVPIGIRK